MSSDHYIFPFHIVSDEGEFHVGNDMIVRPFEQNMREKLLGITNIRTDASGRITAFNAPRHSTLLEPDVFRPVLEQDQGLFFCNYVLACPTHESASVFNLSLKLAGLSSTALHIGFKGPDQLVYLQPHCCYGEAALEVGADEVNMLKKLVTSVNGIESNKKFHTIRDVYLNSMSEGVRRETQYLEVCIVLEMLLLPNNKTELSYRFALRMANLLATVYGWCRREAFAVGKSIYSCRSDLVHSGTSKSLDDVHLQALDVARLLFSHFVSVPSAFDASALDELCLQGGGNE